MRLLVDEMYPSALAEGLQTVGIDATTVVATGLAGSSDSRCPLASRVDRLTDGIQAIAADPLEDRIVYLQRPDPPEHESAVLSDGEHGAVVWSHAPATRAMLARPWPGRAS